MANTPESTPSPGDGNPEPESSTPNGDREKNTDAASDILADFPRSHKFLKKTKRIADLVAPIVAIVAIVYGFIKFIDYDIKQILSDPDTLRKIAAQARPALIFDSN